MYTSPHNWKSQSPGPWSRSPAKTSRALRSGMFRAIQMVLRIKEGGLIHGGPPCSSYVWLNRGTSKRSTACPEGDSSEPSVRISNMNLICVFCGWTWYWWKKKQTCSHLLISLLCVIHQWSSWYVTCIWCEFMKLLLRITARMMILLIIGVCRCVYFAVEQPRSSIMQHLTVVRGFRQALQNLLGIQWQSQNLSNTQIECPSSSFIRCF